ncbi:hypothetical protein SJ05684_c10060 [Sinorhizobium sojae CCBAU 05684]|uniref:Uncharacterized protein n=1 Tax=Sinorhizobium sojae CCBAU 05684 TaxID=716928 RepID=A0A249P9V9_9HYPH|nr:hypothetical protein SJ05684_c10060 [Sinorhizobium sojae CCBAU 05684]
MNWDAGGFGSADHVCSSVAAWECDNQRRTMPEHCLIALWSGCFPVFCPLSRDRPARDIPQLRPNPTQAIGTARIAVDDSLDRMFCVQII